MKIALPLFGLLAVLGIAYGLAFLGVIPTQKMADKSPALASALISLHLAKAKKPMLAHAVSAAPAVIRPEQDALNAQKKQLAAGKAQLAKDQADFEAQKQSAAIAPAAGAASTPSQDSAGKLSAIYAAMSADDLVTIFGKLPDPDVISALMGLDEKKAGKVLAALPADRAARVARLMSHAAPRLQASL